VQSERAADGRDFLIVSNPAAGNTDDKTVRRAVELLSPEADVEVARPTVPADLDGILDRRGDRVVVVVGGDGTLHAMVAALSRRSELATTVVGLIPLGTGNDFARGTGLPLDVEGAVGVLREADEVGVDLLFDPRGQVVVNAVHLGVGVESARKAAAWKSRLGRLAFVLGAVQAGLRAPGVRLELRVDGKVVVDRHRRLLQVAVGNSPSVGGGTRLFPDAAVDDGRLDVVVSAATGRLARLGYAVLLKLGRHRRRDDVWEVHGRTVEIRGHDLWCNADGELYGPASELSWRVEPAALRMLLPSSAGEPDELVE
jgi:diacylglycerol kinase (ATP)